ncbi:MAG: retropepsin-like domain-containing protein [Candidatus Margulisbacteria bacterium]|nr:retropepsin-like domain-containing protein [Candidatus Margulisiibacteriota bacterium]
MPTSVIQYAWREEASESFGKVMRPVAEIHIRDKNDVWRAITMYIDSGADISIVSRSFGELFGHNVAKGKKIKLKGVSGEHIIAYVHKMRMLIGKHEIQVEVAIADVEEIPNILGRKEVFNSFEIQFKNLKKCTCFLRK